MKHRIAITQAFRVHCSTIIEVEAPTAAEAAELVDTGKIEKPYFDDPCWHRRWEMIDETVDPV